MSPAETYEEYVARAGRLGVIALPRTVWERLTSRVAA